MKTRQAIHFRFFPKFSGHGWFSFLLAVLFTSSTQAAEIPTFIRGVLGIHDPSTVIVCNGRYYVFGTGQGIISRSSADKTYWVAGPAVFANPPSWTTNAVPGFTGFFWAPDIIYLNGLYHLYYSCSTFGSQVSAIGLATNPTLDPADPNYLWTDQGPVIQYGPFVSYNTIDPSVMMASDGRLWMALGSFFTGIKLTELDPATGKRITTNSTVYSLAQHPPTTAIEASCIFQRSNYYYLFVNWDTCCSGVNSTYNIRVGRSTNVTGPYLDQNGVSMASGGGTLFLKTTGKYIGPGHMGILNEGATNWFGYHYYDADLNGAPTFDFEPLSWTADGWPAFTNDWSAVYRFQADARDDNGQYYGLLQNNASIRNDPALGHVLNLNGTNQFVDLPDGVANGRTFIAVFKWNGGADWQRVFDFGRSTNRYAFLTSRAANGRLRFAITSSGIGGEQVLDGIGAAPVGTWTHVAVTTDGSRGILYVNGSAVATNNSMTLTAPDIAPTNSRFGRSQFTNDPYFNGQISSVRIYGRALGADEIASSTNSLGALPTPTNGWLAFYPFNGNANDTNGQFNGSLVNGASTPQDVIRGPVLNLNGASQHVNLPTDAGDMRTFAAWVKWNGGGAWQRIFDFGVNNNRYAFLSPLASSGRLRFAIAPSAFEERSVDSPAPFPVNVWTHVAVTLDGRQAVLFLNGRAVAVNNSVNLLPSDIIGNANYLGRSQFPDPYFNGQMDSVLLASDALPIEEITASALNIAANGETITLNWPAFDAGLALHSEPAFGGGEIWTPVTSTPVTTNGFQFLTLPATNANQFFRLQWP